MPTIAETFDQQWTLNEATGCWEWKRALQSENGYGQLSYFGKHDLAHRVSWKRSKGKIPDGLWVLHKCDNPKCINPDHLFLGTPAVNNYDKIAKGRDAKGSTHGQSKLTESAVVQIREAVASGVPQSAVADCLDITRGVISEVVSLKAWAHVAYHGELNGRAVAREAEAKRIRAMYATGAFSQAQLASETGISRSQIQRYVARGA